MVRVKSDDFLFLKTPEKIEFDNKNYELFKLPNELKVLLITQPKSERTIDGEIVSIEDPTSVALCVNVGSFQDPREFQGLAHFVEHMVIFSWLSEFKRLKVTILLFWRFS